MLVIMKIIILLVNKDTNISQVEDEVYHIVAMVSIHAFIRPKNVCSILIKNFESDSLFSKIIGCKKYEKLFLFYFLDMLIIDEKDPS